MWICVSVLLAGRTDDYGNYGYSVCPFAMLCWRTGVWGLWSLMERVSEMAHHGGLRNAA